MITTKKITYSNTKETFQGVLAWNASIPTKRPMVLVAHAFLGQSQFEEAQAIALAKLGYVGFAIDMYGEGKRATTVEESRALMNELNTNRPLLLERIALALQTAKAFEFADPNNIAAIGFCFGGKCVLDLARSGASLKGIASFHGVYDPPHLTDHTPIKASVLILHGWDDPLATPEQTVALAKELTARKADWTISTYGNTGHAFTNPKANSPETGKFFHKKAADRSWKSLTNFLEELFD